MAVWVPVGFFIRRVDPVQNGANAGCFSAFPGCITAAQRNDKVFTSGFSNGELTPGLVLPGLWS